MRRDGIVPEKARFTMKSALKSLLKSTVLKKPESKPNSSETAESDKT